MDPQSDLSLYLYFAAIALGPIIFYVGTNAGRWFEAWIERRNERSGAPRPREYLEEVLGFTPKPNQRWESTHGGRAVAVEESDDHPSTITMAVDHPPDLHIAPPREPGVVDRVLGIDGPLGDEAFGGRLAVSGADARGRAALDADFVRRVKELFFGHGALELDTTYAPDDYANRHHFGKRRILRVKVPKLERMRLRSLLDLLDGIAGLLEGVPLHVLRLGERRAAKGESGAARCAYCHADVTGSEPDLVACEKCGTALHEGCWSENGGCPVLGCGSKERERARAS